MVSRFLGAGDGAVWHRPLGNIAGVAIAVSIGGAGATFIRDGVK